MKKIIFPLILISFVIASCEPVEALQPVTQIPFHASETPLPFIVPVTDTPIILPPATETPAFIISITETQQYIGVILRVDGHISVILRLEHHSWIGFNGF